MDDRRVALPSTFSSSALRSVMMKLSSTNLKVSTQIKWSIFQIIQNSNFQLTLTAKRISQVLIVVKFFPLSASVSSL